MATRLAGSSDLYLTSGRTPLHSINFVTCHDGFTLADLVTYEQKRNWANGEENRDGTSDNLSWNCGVEGETDDPAILALRDRQIRNFLATLLLSQGVPMLLSGDELRRSQGGNNNAYCQDNPTSWIDWRGLRTQASLVDFVAEMIALRQRYPSLRRSDFFSGDPLMSGRPDVSWHGARLHELPWLDSNRCLACWIAAPAIREPELFLMLNADGSDQPFEIPRPDRGSWRCLVDTASAGERWVHRPETAPVVPAGELLVVSRSLVLLGGFC
jgi:glycogen operon protein